MSLVRVYGYLDKIIIPTVAQAEAGFFMDVEPVTVIAGDDPRVREMLSAALDAENPVVATPDSGGDPGSPILDRLGLKKWLKFEADATMYNVYVNEKTIVYYSTGNPVGGVWRTEQAKQREFDRATAREQFVDTILGDIAADRLAREDAKKPKGLMLRPPD